MTRKFNYKLSGEVETIVRNHIYIEKRVGKLIGGAVSEIQILGHVASSLKMLTACDQYE